LDVQEIIMSLTQKTVSGLIWSFLDQFANQGITFIVGIILARLLTPAEFGLIGMFTIFIAISNTFINSGFASALIRKQNCTQVDYSTVFFYNFLVGILLYIVLFILAPTIGIFFNEVRLTPIIRVMGLVIIFQSLSLIQQTILTKRIDFKLQTRISVIASVCAGVIAIVMAYKGFGVWSLVTQQIIRQLLVSILLWLWNHWLPTMVFSRQSFGSLFSFGGKLLISGLIDTIYQNIYYLIIGKYFSAQELGFYTRADLFKNIPSQNLNGIIGRVSYPILASIQDDKKRLRDSYRKLLRSTMFVTFLLMLGMAAVAEPLIITLIGEKWQPSVAYLQMLCFVGIFYPLHALNLNILQVSGRSDLFLKLEIIKKILAIPTIIIGVILGIKIMIVGMIVNTIIAYLLNSYWGGRFVGYSLKEQVKDILPSFLIALIMAIVVYLFNIFLPFNYLGKLIISTIIGACLIIIVCKSINFREYMFIKQLIIDKWKEIRK